jgi:hypothetical protein
MTAIYLASYSSAAASKWELLELPDMHVHPIIAPIISNSNNAIKQTERETILAKPCI